MTLAVVMCLVVLLRAICLTPPCIRPLHVLIGSNLVPGNALKVRDTPVAAPRRPTVVKTLLVRFPRFTLVQCLRPVVSSLGRVSLRLRPLLQLCPKLRRVPISAFYPFPATLTENRNRTAKLAAPLMMTFRWLRHVANM